MTELHEVDELRVAAGDGRRLVVAKRFRYEVKSNAASLVTELLQHRAYRDAFLTAESALHEQVELHGPFALSDIRLEDFEPIDALAARQAIEVFWADETYGVPKPDATVQIERLIRELDLDAGKTLHLAKRDVRQEHPTSQILREGFQEFIVLHPERHVVTLVVLAPRRA